MGADLAGRRRRRSGRCARSPTASTCRPGSSAEMARLFDDYLGAGLARAPRRPGALGRGSSTSPTRSCGRRARRCATTCSPSSASARAQRWTRRARQRRRASSPPARCSIPNALTIGFARRFTGYKRPELIFHDPERLRAHPQRAAPAGADRVRRQGASGRRDRQASPAAGLPARARSDVRRPHRVRRRLRPARRALPRAGLRRLAEQPAQAARGERHERHEGVASTACRTCSIGDGWWAEGYTGDERLADRRPAADRRPGRGGRGRRRRALPICSRTRSCRRSTTATRNGIPRRWLDVRAAGDPHGAPRFSARRMVKEYVETHVRAGARSGSRGPTLARQPTRGSATGAPVGCYNRIHVPKVRRPVALRALRRQGSLRAARRREVLPRLLGQEDRRRRDRRARVRAEALHPRAQRREIPRSTTPR